MSNENPPPSNVKPQGLFYKGAGSMHDTQRHGFSPFFSSISRALDSTVVTTTAARHMTRDEALETVAKDVRRCHRQGGKIIFIGNGGSAAIASHMAVDWTKNGNIRAQALNDAPTLTCIANDFGYEHVFAKQLKFYAGKHDVAVIVSTSGKSPNIVQAAKWAVERMDRRLITLSGMNPDNHLRGCGYINFYIPSMDYGVVEIAHLCLLHSIASVEL